MTNREDFIVPLFPVPVGVYHFNEPYDTETAKNYIKENTKQPNIHNSSSEDVYMLDKPLFSPIKKFITESTQAYAEQAFLMDGKNVEVTISWGNVTKPGQSHHLHHHLNSFISGVYYFNSCQDAPIRLDNPLNHHKQIEPIMEEATDHNMFTCWYWDIGPQEHTLILFPSWLRHSVPKYQGNDERVNIAFNTWFKKDTEIGFKRGKTYLKF